MTEIHVKVSGASAVARRTGPLVAGTVGMPAHFSFDDKWAGLNVIAVFEGSGVSKSVPLLDETSVTVPWECLMKAKTSLRIGLEGRLSDGSIVIPTVWANVGYIEPGAKATDDEGNPPTPGIYDQIMAAIDAGKLKGEKGDKGDTGAQGPVGPAGPQGEKGEKGEKGDTPAIADDLDTKDSTIALSAKMGNVLRNKIDKDLLTVRKNLEAQVKARVKTVNGIAPDENGNVKIEAGGGASVYVQEEEPSKAPVGTLWYDTDEESAGGIGDVFSPVATVTQTASGAVITITDKSGTTTATVVNGKDGKTPVKGTDYFTATEVKEIAEIAAELVGVSEGGGTGIVWRGEWDEETAYNAGDAVSYNGSSYICEVDNMPTGEAPGGVDEWAMLAAKGADGTTPVKGVDYFTEAEKQEIAEQAAGMVEVPGDSGSDSAGGYEVLIDITTTEAVTEFQSPVMDAATAQKFNYASEVFLYVSVPLDKSDTESTTTGNVTVTVFSNYLMTWFSNIGIIPNPTETWTRDGYIFAKIAPTPQRFAAIPRTSGIEQYVWGIGAKTGYGGIVTKMTGVPDIVSMVSGRSYFKVAGSRSMPAGARLVAGVVK